MARLPKIEVYSGGARDYLAVLVRFGPEVSFRRNSRLNLEVAGHGGRECRDVSLTSPTYPACPLPSKSVRARAVAVVRLHAPLVIHPRDDQSIQAGLAGVVVRRCRVRRARRGRPRQQAGAGRRVEGLVTEVRDAMGLLRDTQDQEENDAPDTWVERITDGGCRPGDRRLGRFGCRRGRIDYLQHGRLDD